MVRTRIAPSPTGYPHIGTLFQALFDYVYAKKHQGRFIVRIEDTDQARFVADAETAIFAAFSWFGLTPDESPLHGGDYGPYRQSERLTLYKEHAQKLIDSGHAYYCFCSKERLDTVRSDQQKKGQMPMYDGFCANLDPHQAQTRAQTEPHVVRMKIPRNETITVHDEIRGDITFNSDGIDDQVILKSDGFPTYHLAVVVDDHLMQISHIVRGEEWLSSSPKHVLLYRYFGWDMPKLIHTPLLRNPDRSKLSKRHGHSAVSWYINEGYLKEAVINFLASRVWNHPQGLEIYPLDDLIKYFDFSAMHIQGPIADLNKLDWYNGQWLRHLPDQELFERVKPFLPKEVPNTAFETLWPHYKERLVKLSALTEQTRYLCQDPVMDQQLLLKEAKMTPVELSAYFTQAIQVLSQIKLWQIAEIESSLRALQTKLDLKPRPAFMTLRLAVTGQTATPPLFDILAVLGGKIVIKRLQTVVKLLKA